MTLSDAVVRRAKATGKSYTLADNAGLTLAVSPKGGKSWHFRYYWAGKQKRIILGRYPDISLREARQLRAQTQAQLAKGINPQLTREMERRTMKMAFENNFESIFRE